MIRTERVSEYANILSISDLWSGFRLAEGISKRLICSTEINSEDLNNGIIKQMLSNEEVMVEPKYVTPYTMRCQSSFIWCCNKPPRIDVTDSGLLRRFLYYSMNEKIKNPDPKMNKREWEHDDLVNIVAHALAQDMTNWQKDFERESHLNLVKGNSVYLLKECKTYKDYRDNCGAKGYKPHNEDNWHNIRLLLQEWGFVEKEPIKLEEVDVLGF